MNTTQDKQGRAYSLLRAGLLGAAALAAANAIADERRAAVRSFFCQGTDKSFAVEVPLAVQKAARSVWRIDGPRSSGSGFFIAPRLLVTNFHVVEDFGYHFPEGIDLIQNGEPGEMRIVRLIFVSAIEDVAVLETDRDAPFYLNLREKPLSANEDAFVLGYPSGRAFRFLRKTGPLMNFGGFMQFPVNSGEMGGLSGGPAVDFRGFVSWIHHSYSGNFGLFTKSDYLKGVLEEEPPPGLSRCSPAAPPEECLDKALSFAFEKAEQGDASAQYSVGFRHLRQENFKPAVHWLERSAEQDYAPAQYNLGSMYWYGKGVERDVAKAVFWMAKPAAQGSAMAQGRLGSMYAEGKDFAKAVSLWVKAAERGDALAQLNLGLMYLRGEGGMEQDFEKAADWLKKAAEQGDALAQFNLGLMYVNGDGVKKSLEEAVFWMAQAAAQGYAPALENLFVKTGLLSAALRGEKLCAQP